MNYENYKSAGLNNIVAEQINYDQKRTANMLRKTDLLWLLGKWDDQVELPGFNGHIQSLTKNNKDF